MTFQELFLRSDVELKNNANPKNNILISQKIRQRKLTFLRNISLFIITFLAKFYIQKK